MEFEHQVKVVGANPEDVKNFQRMADTNIDKKYRGLTPELEKTEAESHLIQYGIETARKFLEKKLGIQRPSFPVARVILASSKDLLDPTKKTREMGPYADTMNQQIFLERGSSDIKLALSAAHEWLHLASPTVFYIRKDGMPLLWRQGISAEKHPQNVETLEELANLESYKGLKKLNEAIVGRMTRLLYFDSFFKGPQFKKEIQACKRIKDYLKPLLPHIIKTIEEKESTGKDMSAVRATIYNFQDIVAFDDWQTILDDIKNPNTTKSEVWRKMLINIFMINKIIPLEGHPEEQAYLNEVLKSIVAHNTAHGSPVKEAKTTEGAFWLLSQAEYSGRLLPLARKLKHITGKKDFFNQIANEIIPKI